MFGFHFAKKKKKNPQNKQKKPLRLQTVIVTRGDSLFLPPGIQFHPLFSNMTFKRQLIESKGQ